MRVSTLLAESRTRLDDEILPYKFSDNKILSWLNEAHIQACRRIRYLIETTRISVRAGVSQYDKPSNAIFIRRVKLASQSEALGFLSYKDLDETACGWEEETGCPTHIVTDLSTNKITLYPIPTVNDTLSITSIVEPEQLVGDTDIPSRFAYSLVDWVCYRAFQVYQTEDGGLDGKYSQLAMQYLSNFDREFETPSTAKNEVFDERNRPFNNYDGNW